MNRGELDTLWQQALIESVKSGEQFTRYHFANLVAAAEREACAKVAEKMLRHYTQAVTGVPEAIRARGEK